ncbi:hypothetical protein FVE85_5293 [Porphyridium purpureum]|uniref:Uncharacterized protein n=1 Tax=Porphyridium purpureum TaxID=35688 RepID=A0A5J4Z386_PORPP|nr:hypothetical protein FVE85_5293 [Porphyridium purpureum]|eukprot:POR1954..scf295_1
MSAAPGGKNGGWTTTEQLVQHILVHTRAKDDIRSELAKPAYQRRRLTLGQVTNVELYAFVVDAKAPLHAKGGPGDFRSSLLLLDRPPASAVYTDHDLSVSLYMELFTFTSEAKDAIKVRRLGDVVHIRGVTASLYMTKDGRVTLQGKLWPRDAAAGAVGCFVNSQTLMTGPIEACLYSGVYTAHAWRTVDAERVRKMMEMATDALASCGRTELRVQDSQHMKTLREAVEVCTALGGVRVSFNTMVEIQEDMDWNAELNMFEFTLWDGTCWQEADRLSYLMRFQLGPLDLREQPGLLALRNVQLLLKKAISSVSPNSVHGLQAFLETILAEARWINNEHLLDQSECALIRNLVIAEDDSARRRTVVTRSTHREFFIVQPVPSWAKDWKVLRERAERSIRPAFQHDSCALISTTRLARLTGDFDGPVDPVPWIGEAEFERLDATDTRVVQVTSLRARHMGLSNDASQDDLLSRHIVRCAQVIHPPSMSAGIFSQACKHCGTLQEATPESSAASPSRRACSAGGNEHDFELQIVLVLRLADESFECDCALSGADAEEFFGMTAAELEAEQADATLWILYMVQDHHWLDVGLVFKWSSGDACMIPRICKTSLIDPDMIL